MWWFWEGKVVDGKNWILLKIGILFLVNKIIILDFYFFEVDVVENW